MFKNRKKKKILLLAYLLLFFLYDNFYKQKLEKLTVVS